MIQGLFNISVVIVILLIFLWLLQIDRFLKSSQIHGSGKVEV